MTPLQPGEICPHCGQRKRRQGYPVYESRLHPCARCGELYMKLAPRGELCGICRVKRRREKNLEWMHKRRSEAALPGRLTPLSREETIPAEHLYPLEES